MTTTLDSPKNSDLSRILDKLKFYLETTYQENLEQVILFGSQARGDAEADSDIDILVVLKNKFDSYQENKKISYFIGDLCLANDVVITCFLTALEEWKTKNNAFFRNVHREGIAL